jgi:tetratricopeptide (TPR) repeat protein
MVCPFCGSAADGAGGRCATCGRSIADRAVAVKAATPMPSSASDRVPGEPDLGLVVFPAGPLKPGQAFGARYRILKELGAGGMGVVYQAWDQTLDLPVALKVIRPEVVADKSAADEVERRFKRELLLARQVTHRNVVRIHDLGEVDGIKYISMPFIEGNDLGTVLARSGRMTIKATLDIVRQVAEGLEAAHRVGVVHRDLKPENVMIDAEGRAIIMDFGISRTFSGGTTIGLTMAGAVVGTLEYMAPEQALAQTVDQRADIYALGLIAYDMLAGAQRLTSATTPVSEMMQRLQHAPAPLRTKVPDVPEALERIVARALEPDPEKRYQHASELIADLHAFERGGQPARAARRQVPLWAVGAIVVLLLAGAAALWWLVSAPASTPAAVARSPVTVLIADFKNDTGDPGLDRILEPMLRLALEDAGFISAVDRTLISRNLGVRPPEQLDERAALQLALNQGLGVVLSGALARDGDAYKISLTATQAVTGDVITTAGSEASSRDQILGATTRLAAAVRQALGDNRSESAQRFATQTFSATSLEVVRAYAAAAEALSRGRSEEALQGFAKSVSLDSNFGLGHAGMAIASYNLDRMQDAEKYIREAVRHLDGMTERERYRTRGLFYFITRDHQNCIKEYGDLIARYSADAPARNNLATCLTYQREMPRAIAEMRHAIQILPKRTLYRVNLALYSAYSSDFKNAEEEALALQGSNVFGSLALAFAQLLQGSVTQATVTYDNLGRISDLGASYRASGLADIALYEGRYSDAARLFAQGAAADVASKDPDRAASKFAALAHTEILRGQPRLAVQAADRALENSKAVKIRFLAGRTFIEAGEAARGRTLAAGLGAELLVEPRAYARMLEGEAALKKGDARDAIAAFTDANGLLDTWIGHFNLGRAYLQAGAFTQADSEFDRCITRRGEALALFLDEEPTYGFFPPVYYYQGRVREGLNNRRFAESYKLYLDIRGASTDDPLVGQLRNVIGS